MVVRVAFRGSMDFDMEMWKYATQIKSPSDDPRVVHEHRPNGSAFLMGVEVTTNSLGLREGERAKAKPRARIASSRWAIPSRWAGAWRRT